MVSPKELSCTRQRGDGQYEDTDLVCQIDVSSHHIRLIECQFLISSNELISTALVRILHLPMSTGERYPFASWYLRGTQLIIVSYTVGCPDCQLRIGQHDQFSFLNVPG